MLPGDMGQEISGTARANSLTLSIGIYTIYIHVYTIGAVIHQGYSV